MIDKFTFYFYFVNQTLLYLEFKKYTISINLMEIFEESKITEAKDRHGHKIYIDEAESGKRGYFCLACNKEMQAKKGPIKFHHFSHDPKDQEKNGKCTYMDELYRHKISKEILQALKFIKVPAVYKFPPKDVEGRANKLNDPAFLRAKRVGIEVVFFEDENGIIRNTSSPDWKESEDRREVIRPDVTFFNEADNPILLIELVATHKLSEEKKIKIRHLGIDCVQVLIPKDSPENIEAVFSQTLNTKWIYNGKEARAEYEFIPNGVGGGIPETDEQQRDFFEEGFACRQSAVKHLIRRIRKYLQSELYREAEEGLRSKISRVEENTERERERATAIQDRIRAKLDDEEAFENERIGKEISRVEADTKRERNRTSELQIRIREEIEGDQFPELERIRGRRGILEAAKENVGGRYNRAKETVEREEREYSPECSDNIIRVRSELENLQRRYPELDTTRRRIRTEKARVERELGVAQNTIRSIREQEAALPESAERDEKEESERFERDAGKLESEFGERIQEVRSALEARDFERVSGSSQGLKELFGVRRILDNYISERRYFTRLTKAKKCYDGKSWKNWSIQKP